MWKKSSKPRSNSVSMCRIWCPVRSCSIDCDLCYREPTVSVVFKASDRTIVSQAVDCFDDHRRFLVCVVSVRHNEYRLCPVNSPHQIAVYSQNFPELSPFPRVLRGGSSREFFSSTVGFQVHTEESLGDCPIMPYSTVAERKNAA